MGNDNEIVGSDAPAFCAGAARSETCGDPRPVPCSERACVLEGTLARPETGRKKKALLALKTGVVY